jgi:hypothetical protein
MEDKWSINPIWKLMFANNCGRTVRANNSSKLWKQLNHLREIGKLMMSTEPYDYVDDQFEWRDIKLPGADRARQILNQWEIVSVGKRPIDYMGRDFLISSSLREARMWAMKKFSASPPIWGGQMTEHLQADKTLRKQAIQIVGISFLHLAHLTSLYEEADDAGRILIDHLGGCWPYGVGVRWTGSSRKKKEDICRKPRQCIFCFARLVCELFHRISAGPLQERDDQFLFLGRIRHNYEDSISGRALRNCIRDVKPQFTERLIHEAKNLGAARVLS